MPNEQIYSGSKASDYQPPTGDPQSNVNGNLQPVGGNNLQPMDQTSEQSFPNVDELKVTTVQNGSPTSGEPLTLANKLDNGLSLGWQALLTLLLIVFIAAFWLIVPYLMEESDSAKKPKQSKRKTKKSR